jgi:signal transduction histidine kinase/response regulator RpfG family c-di-GMP phosphodiesterase/HPt (histidine-containing phosphotransfer) domain-containing protein
MILVVDDQIPVCELLKGMCGDQYSIQSVAAGIDAIALLKQQSYDIVVSDFRMPGMSGVEVLGQAAELQPEAVRIMMSGYAEADIVIEAVNKGHIHFFLPKPFKEHEVCNALRQAIGYGTVLRERRELLLQLEKLNRELEQRVRQRTEELREAQRSAQIGSWTWIPSRQTAATTWSDELYQIAGRDPSLPVPSYEEFCDLHTPESRERLKVAVRKALKDRIPYDLDLEMVRPDGAHRWVVARGTSQCDADGNLVQLRGTVQDITERKQTEQALREISEHRGLALEAAELGSWDYCLDTGEVYWDPRRYRMCGITPGVRLDLTEGLQCVHPEDCPTVQSALDAALAGKDGGAYHVEFRVVWPDGSVHWLEGFGRAYFAGEGDQRRAVRFIGISKDITDQKRIEAELLNAKDAAEAANRAKGQFLANMSHEIRTPMNGIMGAAELLLQTKLDSEQQSYLEIARLSGDRMLEVINEILDFSKIEARRVALDQADFELRNTLREVTDVIDMEARNKGLSLTCEISPEVPRLLRGDSGRLRQVLLNLAGNAVKFTPQGEITIRAVVQSTQGSKVTLRFAITDTGIGIQPAHRDIIFSPFVQADGSTTRKYGGTGLGLAISRQLLELMGGQIGVESEPGKGSTFWFTVVLIESLDVGRLALSAAPATKVEISAVNGRGERPRILVAEDNPAGQRIAVAILNKLGYDSGTVANGAEAIQALRVGDYAAVLMDCEMPGMDGYEATRLIRRPETGARDPEIPIVALTADALPGDRENCLQAGMSDYLAKPISMNKLSETLAIWTSSLNRGSNPTPEPTTAKPVFDEASLLRRLMGDRDLAGELIQHCVRDIPDRLGHLRVTVECGDLPAVRFHAHALKGAAANVSAAVLHQRASEMQQASSANDLQRSVQLLPQLEVEFEEFKAALLTSGWTGWQGAEQG